VDISDKARKAAYYDQRSAMLAFARTAKSETNFAAEMMPVGRNSATARRVAELSWLLG
jgi:hypothetical protein